MGTGIYNNVDGKLVELTKTEVDEFIDKLTKTIKQC